MYVVKYFLDAFTACKPYPSSQWPSLPEGAILEHQVTGSEEDDNSVPEKASDGKSGTEQGPDCEIVTSKKQREQ